MGSASAPTPFDSAEMTMEALLATVRSVLEALGDARPRVAAVGIAGMAESGAPLDRSGHPLAPVIAWYDDRGADEVAHLQATFGPDLARRIGQPVRPVMTVVKLGWLVGRGVSGVTRWLGVPELVLHALTGEEATEFSLAARTGCYDVVAKEWIPEVAEAAGFGVDVFPPIAPAGAVMGRVTTDGAAWSGLPPASP